MLPFINAEDLADSKSLLIFLNARGRYHPTTFAPAELEFSHATDISTSLDKVHGKALLYLVENSKDEHRKEDIGYGSVVEFPSRSLVQNVESSGKACRPGKGLEILARQYLILDFLVGCCEFIVHEIPENALLGSIYPILPEPPNLLDQEDKYSGFADAARLSPYRPRIQPDFGRLRHLISTVFETAKDHAWTLWEDLAYFADCLQALMNHRHENILNEKGQTHPSFGSRRLLASSLGKIVKSACMGLVVWENLLQRMTTLENIANSLPELESHTTLLEAYKTSVESVYFHLRCERDNMALTLGVMLTGSRQLRHLL
ncbi:hypothetical protein CC86DRAFT_410898 [Ophiobolus disseminans]|uniref:Uncharacterized protein n=1 Tax=Ophiobolus disseminans TaxID=1469910 RepID=A0A6A6ZMC1_9PLEO|nr:hypothetical protein CC86DRAFT_410898 [Ophiobolus disseminans]